MLTSGFRLHIHCVQASHDGFSMVEDRLRSFGQHNLHELVEFQDSLRNFGQRRVDQLTGFGQAIKYDCAWFGMEEQHPCMPRDYV